MARRLKRAGALCKRDGGWASLARLMPSMFAPSRNQKHGAGVFQLISDFALAVRRIEQRGDGAGELCGVKRRAEFPGVREEDGDHVARLDAAGDHAAGRRFDDVSIFGVGQASSAGSIYHRGLGRIAAAGLKYKVMQKEIVGIGVEFGAEHAGRDCSGKKGITKQPALAGQLPKEFLLVHVVFESLSAVDEHDRNFVVELAAKFEIQSTSISCQVNPPRRESLERLSFTTSHRWHPLRE